MSAFLVDSFPALLDIAVKSLVMLAVGAAAASVLHRASAALRHFVWTLAFGAVLLLPLLCVTVPQATWLPSWLDVRMALRDESTGIDQTNSQRAAGRERSVAIESRSDAGPVETNVSAAAHPGAGLSVPEVEQPVGASPRTTVRDGSRKSLALPLSLIAIWATGVCVSWLAIAAGMLSLWRLSRSSRQVAAELDSELLFRLCQQLGIRPVTLLQSDRRSIPMTWGLLRPRVLVPNDFDSWTAERKEVVLLHELTHVKRSDYVIQLFARLACSLHWFNPLIWFAARQIGRECERACDDMMLRLGQRPSSYAEHLLRVGTQMPGNALVTGIAAAMAGRADISDRVRLILDSSRSRKPVTRRALACGTITVSFMALLLAGLRSVQVAAETPATTAAAETNDDSDTVEPADNDAEPLPAGATARLGTTRWRHKTEVAVAHFSPDGKMLATAGLDTIRLWDMATGKQLHELTETGCWLTYGVAFSPDASKLASVQQSGVIRLWNVATGKQVCLSAKQDGEAYERYGIAYSADGKLIATVGAKDVRLWKADTLRMVKRFLTKGTKGSTAPGVAFSPDNKLLTASGAAHIHVWNLETDQSVQSISDAHLKGVTALVFTPDSKTVISGGNGNRVGGPSAEIALWDVATGDRIEELLTVGVNSRLYSLALSQNGEVLVSGHQSEARVWNLKQRELTRVISEGYSRRGPYTMNMTADGKLLAAPSDGNAVGIWDVETGKLSNTTESHQRSVGSVAGNGTIVVTAGRSGTARIWDLASGQLLKHLKRTGYGLGLSAVAIAPGGQTIAVGGGQRVGRGPGELEFDGRLRILDLDPSSEPVESSLSDVIGKLTFSPDGKTIAAATDNTPFGLPKSAAEAILIIDAETGETKKRLAGHPGNISAIAFGADDRLFSLSIDSMVREWDVEVGKPVRTFEIIGHQRPMVSHAAFSPNCKFLVTCDMFGKELIVTDVAAGKHLHTLPVPDTLGNQFAISPDGRTLASACQPITDTDTRFDEQIHLWDLATGRKLHSLAASSDGTVASLTFLDEQTLASGMDRGTALIWDVSDFRN